MADNQQKQAPAEVKPVKKRRFFRPKAKPSAEAVKASTEEVKRPSQQKQGKPATAKADKASKPLPSKMEKSKKAVSLTKTNNESPKSKPQPDKNAPVVKASKQAAPAAKPQASATKPSQTMRKTTPKNNSNFKPRRPAGQPRLKLADIDFKYLDTPKFKDIYALVTKAQSYFENDKETCCTKFRIANEAIISRLIKKLQLTEAVDETNYFEQINLLSKNISSEMVDENIFAEMHNIRMIGNSFAHGDDKYSPANGSKTCLIAMEKICRWLVEFEPKYDSYQRAKAATSSSALDDILNAIKKLPSTIVSLFKGK